MGGGQFKGRQPALTTPPKMVQTALSTSDEDVEDVEISQLDDLGLSASI